MYPFSLSFIFPLWLFILTLMLLASILNPTRLPRFQRTAASILAHCRSLLLACYVCPYPSRRRKTRPLAFRQKRFKDSSTIACHGKTVWIKLKMAYSTDQKCFIERVVIERIEVVYSSEYCPIALPKRANYRAKQPTTVGPPLSLRAACKPWQLKLNYGGIVLNSLVVS